MAFAFGLLHGLGFAGALGRVGLPANEIPVALFAFNGGVEVGQLGVVGGVIALRRVRGSVARWSAVTAPAPAYTIGSLAAFWMIERIRSMLV